jgi:hypothetical protein
MQKIAAAAKTAAAIFMYKSMPLPQKWYLQL